MKNPKQTISASEVNKYLHCPYQWYYERYYGRKYLTQAKNAFNEALGREMLHPSDQFFSKGRAFHDNYGKPSFLRRLGMLVLGFAVVAAGVLIIRWLGGSGW